MTRQILKFQKCPERETPEVLSTVEPRLAINIEGTVIGAEVSTSTVSSLLMDMEFRFPYIHTRKRLPSKKRISKATKAIRNCDSP